MKPPVQRTDIHRNQPRPVARRRPLATRPRCGFVTASLTALVLCLAACGSSPPVQLFQLRADPPGAAASAPAPTPAATRWSLGPVQLPDYLDRDAIVRPSGQATLATLPGQRWAEPLRDAVPRLLLQDLIRLRGEQQVWRAPLPPGVQVDRQLRVDLQRLDADADGHAVVLQARWMLIDPRGSAAPEVHQSRIAVPLADPRTDTLVSAHRLALWRLAQDIVARAPR